MEENNNDFFFGKLSRFQRLYGRALSARLAPYDVNPGYLSILQSLWEQDDVTQKTLRKRVDIEQATLSNTLKRMERDTLVVCTPNSKDRRLHAITLTERGRSIRPVVMEALDDLQRTVNQGLTINDLRYFKRIMRQMSELLEDDLVEPLFVLLDEVKD